MVTKVHQLVLLPGKTMQFFCKDGLSPATVFNIDLIYRFSGNLKFINCGTGNIYAALWQAKEDMYNKWIEVENKHN